MKKHNICRLIAALSGAVMVAGVQAESLGLDASVGLAGVLPDITSPVVGADASNQVVPIINLTYYLSDHFALNTAAGITRHRFDAGGAYLGRASMAPFHLMAQYHFSPGSAFRPYVGAGIHHTIFFRQKGPTFDNLEGFPSDTGGVLEAGAFYALSPDYFLNFDVKKFYLETDVTPKGGAKIETIKLDPWVVSFTVGTRF